MEQSTDLNMRKLRQNIHTYPFKYQYLDPQKFFTSPKASIYIHIPFCSTKCHFCDYTVYVNKNMDAREQYVQALCKEIARFEDLRTFPSFDIDAIYFGGGTPGLLEGEQLARILRTCRDNFQLLEGAEVCVEFDPRSVSLEKLQQVKEAGVNRVSVGVQSFDNEILKTANRPHNTDDIYAAFDAIHKAQFQHTNLDLIYPFPNQTREIWTDSVQRALALKPSCVTLYGLEVWPGTAYYAWFKKGNLALPDNETEVWMYASGAEALGKAGFVPGSTSGYYHPDRAPRYCRFLEYYWRTWPMIGFGVSSKSVVLDHLWTNVKPLQEYIRRIDAGEPVLDFATQISKPQEMRRVMIRGLKMCSVDKRDFLARFGVEMEVVFGKEIQDLVGLGLVEDGENDIRLTFKGRVYGPNVYARFYTEDDTRPAQQGEVQFGISQLIEV